MEQGKNNAEHAIEGNKQQSNNQSRQQRKQLTHKTQGKIPKLATSSTIESVGR